MNPIDLAASAIGLNEADKKAALSDYLSTGGANLDPAVTAWCAAFVNATLQQSGMEGTGSNMARSYLDWGQPVDQPQRGDVAVFSRGDPNGPYGHVGFFEGYNPDGTIRVLGGNQGDSVSIANYSPNALLGFRRGETGQQPQNALAAPQGQPQGQPMQQPRLTDYVNFAAVDPSAFMTPRNALQAQAIPTFQRGA